MNEWAPTELTSDFLLSLRAAFVATRFGSELEFREETSSRLPEQSLEVCLYKSRQGLHVYQTLTVWSDRVAILSVRENVTKRLHKLLFKLEEFPLLLEPEQIVDLFKESATRLLRLDFPPGESAADRELLEEVGALWFSAARERLH